MKPGLRSGQLVKWKDERGFGFIQPVDGSQDVFLHISDLKDSTRRPQVGDTIYYYIVAEDGKIRAGNAFILGARSKPNSLSPAKSNSFSSSLRNKPASNGTRKDRFPLLEMLLLSILPVIGSSHLAWTTANPIPLLLYPAMSLLTLVLYAEDKARAKRGHWRIPENTLHLCEFAGGWIGGLIAQRILRHKTIKSSYQSEFWAIVVLHTGFWIVWLFFGRTILKTLIGSGFRQ